MSHSKPLHSSVTLLKVSVSMVRSHLSLLDVLPYLAPACTGESHMGTGLGVAV